MTDKLSPEARRALRRQAQSGSTDAPRVTPNPTEPRLDGSAQPPGAVPSVKERVPRLPCPECRFVISLSLHDLMTAPSFTCPQCQTTLNLLRGESS